MASLLSPPLNLPLNKANDGNLRALSTKTLSSRDVIFRKNSGRNVQFPTIKVKASLEADVLDKSSAEAVNDDFGVVGLHHVGILCENLERSLHFYQNVLGLPINEARPHDKLPYRGAWLWVGPGMIHLMELPNPDPLTGRPEHGGRDRHACLAIRDVSKLKDILDKAGIPYTLSRSGRPAIFTRDPDTNALEFTQVD
ncbi:Lactoylglutathione lyase / glyoxalase I family protein [Perilla frutescens var. hirtella]|uniref:Lactoylglutathione lyase / glyoxalase I family protein n=1 Tax=Perilla frutescens var. hirtella TaxID=608512 RepID=A0AAD4J7G9_PERFH|nr:Lactoylglutathione lyase / glyoxalase I family protein [Perilla frutescens var. hirtella]